MYGRAPQDPCDMVKATLPEPQSPAGQNGRPIGTTPGADARRASASQSGGCNLRGTERCSVRAFKEMSGAPTVALDTYHSYGTWDRLSLDFAVWGWEIVGSSSEPVVPI